MHGRRQATQAPLLQGLRQETPPAGDAPSRVRLRPDFFLLAVRAHGGAPQQAAGRAIKKRLITGGPRDRKLKTEEGAARHRRGSSEDVGRQGWNGRGSFDLPDRPFSVPTPPGARRSCRHRSSSGCVAGTRCCSSRTLRPRWRDALRRVRKKAGHACFALRSPPLFAGCEASFAGRSRLQRAEQAPREQCRAVTVSPKGRACGPSWNRAASVRPSRKGAFPPAACEHSRN